MDIKSYVLGFAKGMAQGGGSSGGSNGGGDTSTDERVKYVTFMYGATELIKYPVISGDTVRDPVAKGLIETPTKESTVSHIYPFGGWSMTNGGAPNASALQNVTEDRTVYASFNEEVRCYTVRFYDGDTLVNTEQVAYNTSSYYMYSKIGYNFNGWLPEPTNITADTDCYAQWSVLPTFAHSSWAQIKAVVDEGKASNAFALGDTRSVTFTYSDGRSETIDFEVVDTSFLDTGKMAVMAKQCLKTPYKLNSSDSYDTYMGSELATYMKNTIFNCLPSELQDVIHKGTIERYATNDSYVYYLYIPRAESLSNSNNFGFDAYIGVDKYPCTTVDGTKVNYWLDGVMNAKPQYVETDGTIKESLYNTTPRYIRPVFFI